MKFESLRILLFMLFTKPGYKTRKTVIDCADF